MALVRDDGGELVLAEALERALETNTRGRRRPAQKRQWVRARHDATCRPAISRRSRTASGSRSGEARTPARDRTRGPGQREQSKSSSAISRTPWTWTSPRGRPSNAPSSTSRWKRMASSTKISASRNAVTPNAATANSARRRSFTARPTGGASPAARGRACRCGGRSARAQSPKSATSASTSASARACRYGVARDRRRVDVEPAGAPPDEQALRVEPRHHGQQRRVRADLAAARIQRLLDVAHGRLRTRPRVPPSLGFQA